LEPFRIKLVDRLREGEASVLDLTEAIGTTELGLTGSATVPTLLLENGSALVGADEILAYLERH
jgi:hypothetical protein